MTEPSALELADRLATMPANEAVRGPQDWALIMRALRAHPAQGEPVAWRWRKIGCDWWIYRDEDDFPDGAGELQPLYAAPFSPDLAEDCAKIAGGHVGMYRDEPKAAGYDEACCDIANAIRGTYGHE